MPLVMVVAIHGNASDHGAISNCGSGQSATTHFISWAKKKSKWKQFDHIVFWLSSFQLIRLTNKQKRLKNTYILSLHRPRFTKLKSSSLNLIKKKYISVCEREKKHLENNEIKKRVGSKSVKHIDMKSKSHKKKKNKGGKNLL